MAWIPSTGPAAHRALYGSAESPSSDTPPQQAANRRLLLAASAGYQRGVAACAQEAEALRSRVEQLEAERRASRSAPRSGAASPGPPTPPLAPPWTLPPGLAGNTPGRGGGGSVSSFGCWEGNGISERGGGAERLRDEYLVATHRLKWALVALRAERLRGALWRWRRVAAEARRAAVAARRMAERAMRRTLCRALLAWADVAAGTSELKYEAHPAAAEETPELERRATARSSGTPSPPSPLLLVALAALVIDGHTRAEAGEALRLANGDVHAARAWLQRRRTAGAAAASEGRGMRD